MKNGTKKYWACYHKNLGWLNFISSNWADASPDLDIKCLFTDKKFAERRLKENVVFCKAANGKKYKNYSVNNVQVVEVIFNWQADI